VTTDLGPVAVVASRLRIEEKRLLEELDRRGVPSVVLDPRRAVFRGDAGPPPYRGAVAREISHTRNLYAARLLEHTGVRVVNDSRVLALCGDKLLTTLALQEAGLPVPPYLATLVPEAALPALDELGWPAVVKPLTGSWGRLAAKLDGPLAAEAVLEHRAALPDPHQRITFVQRYIDKPGRDIKSYVMGGEVVGAIYKVSDQWRTNTARGGRAEPCPVDDDLAKLLSRAAAVIGDGVLGIDVLEDRDGRRYVNEVNDAPEFHGAIEVLPLDLVGRYVDHVLDRLGADR
jgi:[lysine-biosynthesis-protein LysW]---L-2-aminoadipate ligase